MFLNHFSPNQRYGQKGFTLIEVIVSISIFIVVMVVAAGAVLSIIDANRKSHATKSVIDSLNFILEDFARNVVTGSLYSCSTTPSSGTISGALPTDNCPTGWTNNFSFKDQNGKVVVYSYDPISHQITVSHDGGVYLPVNSPEVYITSFDIYVMGVGRQSPNPEQQPRVFVTIRGYGAFGDPTNQKYRTEFNVQTSITQRNIERLEP